MNKLLKRQLFKMNLSITQMPIEEKEWTEFVRLINTSYKEYDEHLNRAQNTLEIAVNEMQQFYKGLEIRSIQNSKLAVLGEMVGSIAHEINNPLMVLTSLTYLLQKMCETQNFEQAPEKVEQILKTIHRINSIINGLRTFSRDGEKDPLAPVEIDQIINETMTLCSDGLNYKDIYIQFENQLNGPVKINCRSTQIMQVLLNLISNAKDAVENLDERWIKINLQKIENTVRIKITDSGPGIPKDIRDQIFQPFFTTKDTGSGTGLGLSISKNIIETHHGKIEISTESNNTSFVITLPISAN